MITQSESGLDTATYNALLNEAEIGTRVLVSQYTLPLLQQVGSWSGQGEYDFAALGGQSRIVRAYSESGSVKAESIDHNGSATVSSLGSGTSVSLARSGGTIRLFYLDGDNLMMSESTDDGLTWSQAQTIATVSGAQFAAAANTESVFVVYTGASGNPVLASVDWDSATSLWVFNDGTVHWPFDIRSVAAGTVSSGTRVLLLTTELPPTIGHRVIKGSVTRTLSRTTGVIAFCRRTSGVWETDYRVVYTVDGEYQGSAAEYVTALSLNGQLFAVFLANTGRPESRVEYIALTKTVDGDGWELPMVYDRQAFENSRVALAVTDDGHAYLLSSTIIWETRMSPWLVLDESRFTDISGQVLEVRVIQSQSADVARATIVLSGELPQDVTPLSTMIVKLGRSGSYVKIATMDVRSIETTVSKGITIHTITAEDYLGRFQRVRSPGYEWFGTSIAGDNWHSPDNSEYSGLRHTAPISGTWKSINDELRLVSNNNPGIAATTLLPPQTWCFDAQVGIKVNRTDQEEYAGLAFWIHDAKNYWGCIYHSQSDTIKLFYKRDGNTTNLAESAALNWGVGSWRYIRVSARYAKIRVYTSTDGVAWTLLLEHEHNHVQNTHSLGELNLLVAGRVGVTGKGYSDVDQQPPSYDYPGYEWPEPPEPPVAAIPPFVVAWNQWQVGRTTNFDEDPPTWEWIAPMTKAQILADMNWWFARVSLDPNNNGRAVVSACYSGNTYYGKVWYTDDITASPVVWTEVLNDMSIVNTLTASGFSPVHPYDNNNRVLSSVILPSGRIVVLIYTRLDPATYTGSTCSSAQAVWASSFGVLLVSDDNGATWNALPLTWDDNGTKRIAEVIQSGNISKGFPWRLEQLAGYVGAFDKLHPFNYGPSGIGQGCDYLGDFANGQQNHEPLSPIILSSGGPALALDLTDQILKSSSPPYSTWSTITVTNVDSIHPYPGIYKDGNNVVYYIRDNGNGVYAVYTFTYGGADPALEIISNQDLFGVGATDPLSRPIPVSAYTHKFVVANLFRKDWDTSALIWWIERDSSTGVVTATDKTGNWPTAMALDEQNGQYKWGGGSDSSSMGGNVGFVFPEMAV